MTFNPVIHPALLLLLVLGVLALVGLGLVRARSGSERSVWVVRALIVIACFAALLRPGVPGGEAETFATDADVFIVLDTTASMVAEDWGDGQPRLDGARDDVDAIVAQYPGARFSLITFDSATSVRLPLTTDTAALRSAMAVLSPEVTQNSQGSSVTEASSVLRDSLKGAAEGSQGRSRIVFYLGDGEQTASGAIGSFASSAQFIDAGRVLGYGSDDGGPMRVTEADPRTEKSEYIEYQGSQALSKMNPENLGQIASQLGVEYERRSSVSTPQLPAAPPVTTQTASGVIGNVIELYWIFAGIAVLLLALEVSRAVAASVRLRELLPARQPRHPRRERGER